jgi:hypothetical protein
MTGWVEWLSPSIPQSWRSGGRPFSLSVLIYLLRLAWWIFRVQYPVDGGREYQILEFWALIFFFFAFDFILLVTVVLGSVADTAKKKWLSGRTTPTNLLPVAESLPE